MKRWLVMLLPFLLCTGGLTWVAGDIRLFLTTSPIAELGLDPSEIHRNEKGQVTRIVVTKTRVTDGLLKRLPRLRYLRYLWLAGSPVSDQGMRSLSRLPNLRDLFLNRTNVTGTGAVHLQALSKLERLVLSDAPVNDRGLASVASLKHLRILQLDGTRITDAGASHLRHLATLVDLDVSGTQLTNRAIADLAQLGTLKSLRLRNTGLAGTLRFPKPSGLRSLDLSENPDLLGLSVEGIPAIQMLNLRRTGISDETFQPRSVLRELRDLNLSETSITGASLGSLASSPSLQWLDLSGSQADDRGLKQLQPLKQLRVLILGRTRISDGAGQSLGQLSALVDLDLSQTSIGDTCVGALTSLKSLKRLVLQRTRVSDRRSDELKRALPQLRIITAVENPREDPPVAPGNQAT